MKHANTYAIYFGSSELLFTRELPSAEYAVVEQEADGTISRAKVIKKVETDKFVAIIAKNPYDAFSGFGNEFRRVEAAGGAVINDRGELLMIFSRNHWDLPKGHIEAGEEPSVAALREVSEETGIVAELVDREPIYETYHAYDTYGHWELKRTRWWLMRPLAGELKPQTEEGIVDIAWCDKAGLADRLKSSYETIKMVVEALEKMER